MNRSETLGAALLGLDDPGTPERPAGAWLDESIGWVALLAARRTYADQPGLWGLGEPGRARTVEDFTHHLRAAIAGPTQWRRHVGYCLQLFDTRGFPFRWLTDAFATLSAVLLDELPEALTADVRHTLDSGTPMLAALAEADGVDLRRPTRYDDG